MILAPDGNAHDKVNDSEEKGQTSHFQGHPFEIVFILFKAWVCST